MIKKIILILSLFVLLSCGNKKSYITYTNDDFYISYNREKDVYICKMKENNKTYNINSDDVIIKVLPYERKSEYKLYIDSDNRAYRLEIYIGVDD